MEEAPKNREVAKTPKNREVPVTELTLSLSYQFEALIRLLERKGIVSKQELLAEVKRIGEEQGRQKEGIGR